MKSRRRITSPKGSGVRLLLLTETRLQQGFTTGGTGSDRYFAWRDPQDRMSALKSAEQTSPRACGVKPPHIASLTTKAFFRKCQIARYCRQGFPQRGIDQCPLRSESDRSAALPQS